MITSAEDESPEKERELVGDSEIFCMEEWSQMACFSVYEGKRRLHKILNSLLVLK